MTILCKGSSKIRFFFLVARPLERIFFADSLSLPSPVICERFCDYVFVYAAANVAESTNLRLMTLHKVIFNNISAYLGSIRLCLDGMKA